MAQSLIQLATTGKSTAAAIFWMKTRGGWRERRPMEAPPFLGKRILIPSLRDASDEELAALLASSEHRPGDRPIE